LPATASTGLNPGGTTAIGVPIGATVGSEFEVSAEGVSFMIRVT
jgi:hypothetical protein